MGNDLCTVIESDGKSFDLKETNPPFTLSYMANLPGPRLAAFSLCLLSLVSLSAPQLRGVEYGQVAAKVATLLQHEHYNDQNINDEVSKKLLDNYLEFLDGGRLYFLQSDIDAFKARYETRLDEKLLLQDISPALDIYYIYTDRVINRVNWIKKFLETKEFTFDSDRNMQLSRKDAPWAKNAADADQIWANIIEGEMLQEVMRREMPANDKVAAELEKMDEPAVLVRKRYDRILDSLKDNTTEDIAGFYLKSLSHTYDPHSDYFTQSEYENFQIQMSKNLQGIGALLSMTDEGYAEIRGLVVGGPAHQAGELQVGDKIIGVGQGQKGALTDIKHMNLQKVVDLIRGKKGSHVRLKLIPNGEDPSSTAVISIRRDQVDLKESLARAELIETKAPDGRLVKLGWIDLPSFYSDMQSGQTSVTRDTKRLLLRLKKEGIEGLILDLRQNGGGSLEEAINLTGLFIPKGPVVQSKDSRDQTDVKVSPARVPVYDGPLVVLTSKASASASEILAAALQDYQRAVIVGESSTFGKGTVQQLLPVTTSGFSLLLPGNSNQAGALKLTIQKFYRIAGGSTQLKGVVPDIILPSITDAMELGEASLKDSLPYDEVAKQKFALFRKQPLPIDSLKARSEDRRNENADFQWIVSETNRFEERREENQISLNREVRKQEIEQEDARDEERKEDIKKRFSAIKKAEEGLFTSYSLTLDRIDEPQLKLLSEVSAQELSGMMTDIAEKDEEAKALEPPHGFGPVKREAIDILMDFVTIEKLGEKAITAVQEKKSGPAAN